MFALGVLVSPLFTELAPHLLTLWQLCISPIIWGVC